MLHIKIVPTATGPETLKGPVSSATRLILARWRRRHSPAFLKSSSWFPESFASMWLCTVMLNIVNPPNPSLWPPNTLTRWTVMRRPHTHTHTRARTCARKHAHTHVWKLQKGMFTGFIDYLLISCNEKCEVNIILLSSLFMLNVLLMCFSGFF